MMTMTIVTIEEDLINQKTEVMTTVMYMLTTKATIELSIKEMVVPTATEEDNLLII